MSSLAYLLIILGDTEALWGKLRPRKCSPRVRLASGIRPALSPCTVFSYYLLRQRSQQWTPETQTNGSSFSCIFLLQGLPVPRALFQGGDLGQILQKDMDAAPRAMGTICSLTGGKGHYFQRWNKGISVLGGESQNTCISLPLVNILLQGLAHCGSQAKCRGALVGKLTGTVSLGCSLIAWGCFSSTK